MTAPGPTSPDPFELLASMRPADLDRRVDPGDDPAIDALLADIVAGTTNSSGPPPRRRWRRRVIGGAVVLAVAGGGAVAASRLLSSPTDSAALSCYSNASALPDIQVALIIDPSSTPEQQCAPMWSDGTLGTSGPPQLASCVTDTGITAVIPDTGDTCTAIGFEEREPVAPGTPNPAATITNAISDTWTNHDGCVRDLDEARRLLEQIFIDAGAEGWTIRVMRQPTTDEPCIAAGIDPEAHEVFLGTYAEQPSP